MPGPHALRSIDCAARAYKAGQKLTPRAANVSVSVTARKIGGGLGSPFGPGRSRRTSGASGSLRSRRARSPLGPADPCALPRLASFAVRWRQVGRRTGSAALTDQALWTDRVLADPLDSADSPERRALEGGQLRPTARKDLAALVHDCNPPWVTRAVHWEQKPLPDVRLGLAAKSSPHCASSSTKVGRTCLVTAHYDRRRGSSSSLVGLARICYFRACLKLNRQRFRTLL